MARKNTKAAEEYDNKLLQEHELEKFGHDLNFKRSSMTRPLLLLLLLQHSTTNRVSQRPPKESGGALSGVRKHILSFILGKRNFLTEES